MFEFAFPKISGVSGVSGVSGFRDRFNAAKLALLSFAVMLVLGGMFAAPARAALTMEFPGDIKLVFEEGNFDTETYNGALRKVSLFERGELLLTADTLEIVSDGAPSDDKFFLRKLDMTNVVLNADKASIDSLALRNIDFGGLQSLAKPYDFADALRDDSSIVVEGFTGRGKYGIFRIDLIETLPLTHNTLPNGSRYASAGGFQAVGMRYHSKRKGGNSPETRALSKMSGLVVDLVMSQKSDLVLGALQSQYSLEMVVRDHGHLTLNSDINLQLDTYDKMVALGNQGAENAGEALNLLGEIELVKIGIDYSDDGLIDLTMDLIAAIEGTSPAAAKQAKLDAMVQRVEKIFPRTGATITEPLTGLIADGGGLRVRVEPNAPLPISSLLGLMIVPDLAFDRLNLKMVHLKGS